MLQNCGGLYLSWPKMRPSFQTCIELIWGAPCSGTAIGSAFPWPWYISFCDFHTPHPSVTTKGIPLHERVQRQAWIFRALRMRGPLKKPCCSLRKHDDPCTVCVSVNLNNDKLPSKPVNKRDVIRRDNRGSKSRGSFCNYNFGFGRTAPTWDDLP